MEIPTTGEIVTWVITSLDDDESFQVEMNESLAQAQRMGATILSITFTTSQEQHFTYASTYSDEGLIDQWESRNDKAWVMLTKYNAFLLVHFPNGSDDAWEQEVNALKEQTA